MTSIKLHKKKIIIKKMQVTEKKYNMAILGYFYL